VRPRGLLGTNYNTISLTINKRLATHIHISLTINKRLATLSLSLSHTLARLSLTHTLARLSLSHTLARLSLSHTLARLSLTTHTHTHRTSGPVGLWEHAVERSQGCRSRAFVLPRLWVQHSGNHPYCL
jgi:hypothetical protein